MDQARAGTQLPGVENEIGMRIRAALFDMDGTLAYTLEDIAGAMNRVLSRRGYPTLPVEAYGRLVSEESLLSSPERFPREQRCRDGRAVHEELRPGVCGTGGSAGAGLPRDPGDAGRARSARGEESGLFQFPG